MWGLMMLSPFYNYFPSIGQTKTSISSKFKGFLDASTLSEVFALYAFKETINEDLLMALSNWNVVDASACDWSGISYSMAQDRVLKLYEPLSYFLGIEYFIHVYNPIYALSTNVVSSLVALRTEASEDEIQAIRNFLI